VVRTEGIVVVARRKSHNAFVDFGGRASFVFYAGSIDQGSGVGEASNDVGVWTPSAGEVEDVGDTFVAVGSVGSSEVSSAFGWRRRESTGGDR